MSRTAPRALLLAVLAATAAHVPVTVRAASPPAAAAHTPLDTYLEGLATLRASFTQTLADAQGREIDRASGKLIVVRPGKFSWEIHPEHAGTGPNAGQLMVADGRNVWFLDRDLDQVTVKPVDAALTATPAMLLSGTVDLHKSFKVTPGGSREGLDWVLVEPRSQEADFKNALFGFDHGNLRRMILEDKLGQLATITFEQAQRNGPVAPNEVTFTPPAGTDVIGKPR